MSAKRRIQRGSIIPGLRCRGRSLAYLVRGTVYAKGLSRDYPAPKERVMALEKPLEEWRQEMRKRQRPEAA